MTKLDELHLLKTLDPADQAPDPHHPRARAGLHRILATEPAAPAVRARPHRRRVAGRIAAATGLVAAGTAAAIVVPAAIGGDPAFATWTARPTAMSTADRAKAAEACREEHRSGSPDYRDELAAATPAIAERRGNWSLVVLAGADGFSALCVADRPRPLFDAFFGSIGATRSADRPGPRELTATSLGTGAIDNHELSVAVGLAGAEVAEVSYTSPSRGRVLASVTDGQFALWLPGDDLAGASRRGVPLRVTYHDGSTATVTVAL
ncbi:hypothetical protein [Microlunatus speluncae]|uniref:hypothetical protein n=1 Tax=Microlunatus speluncae TaxID=2594267 RepID=UPI0012661F02|nr:hypothetical protein [Microlunatus speluncae]